MLQKTDVLYRCTLHRWPAVKDQHPLSPYELHGQLLPSLMARKGGTRTVVLSSWAWPEYSFVVVHSGEQGALEVTGKWKRLPDTRQRWHMARRQEDQVHQRALRLVLVPLQTTPGGG